MEHSNLIANASAFAHCCIRLLPTTGQAEGRNWSWMHSMDSTKPRVHLLPCYLLAFAWSRSMTSHEIRKQDKEEILLV